MAMAVAALACCSCAAGRPDSGCPGFTVELPRGGSAPAVSAASFGLSEEGTCNAAAINAALAEAKRIGAKRVELAPGTYRCLDARGIVVDGFEDFTFDGCGAVLVFRRPPVFTDRPGSAFDPESSSVLVRNCRRTLVENLTLDWDWESDPLAAFAVARDVFVSADDPQGSFVDFEFTDYSRHPSYPSPVPVQMTVGMDESRTGYSRERATVQFGLSEGHFGAKNEWVAPNVLRVWPRVPMPGANESRWFKASLDPAENRAATREYAKGGLYRVQHCYYGKNGVNLVSNVHLTLRNVHVWSCFGMGLAVDGAQRHFQVEDFSVAPPSAEEFARAYPGAAFLPRPMSSSADAIHVMRSQGWGRFLRCRCSLNSDDSVNIHDIFTLAVRASDRVLEIVNRRGAEYARFEPGDELELRNPDFSPTGFRARLAEVRGDRYVVDADLPVQKGACFLVWNRTYRSDRFHFKDCVFEDTGWRNLFSCSDLTIEGCVFRRTLGSAIRFVADYRVDRWCEGMGTTNMVVRNCLFDDVNIRHGETPVISTSCVLPDDWDVGPVDPGFVGAGLRVEDCRFVNVEGPALELGLGRDVVFSGNEIVPGERSRRNPAAGTVRDLCGALGGGRGPAATDWPSARHFDDEHLLRVALPMGGIGCGAVSLSGRGELVDWEIMNRANKTTASGERGGASRTFFAIRVKGASHESTSMLAGPLHPSELCAAEGNCAPQSGLPRFRQASFDGAFPFGVVHLADKDLPVKVEIRGFSPFVPGDSAASSLPVASLEYEVENLSGEPLEVSVAAFVRNIVGNDGNPVGFAANRLVVTGGEKDNRTVRREGAGLRGLMCLSDGVAADSPAWGTFALSTPDADGSLTVRESLAPGRWGGTVLDFWDDLSDDGELNRRPAAKGVPHGALALKKSVPARGRTSYRFAFTWNFPNRPAWLDSKTIVGNWYSRHYADAWDAAEKIVPRLAHLEARSLAFTRKVLALDAPAEIKEAALSNLAVLKSQTVFRVPSGHLMGWEGVYDHEGSCRGSCTHVWNYENAVACLFPDLARSMRDVEFNYAMDAETGAMDFRAALPLGAKRNGRVAADGQMGCVMKAYRDWKICGDGEWLAAIWPKVKKALSFAWTSPGGWDAAKSGLMDGEQPNTMDVSYYGPNPQMGFWYLGALRAAEEMARAAGDGDFARECREIFERGSRRIDRELFNGDYYEQRIPEGRGEIPHQLGKGCLVDQLVGQQMAHLWGLGDLAKKENLRKTCESIMRWNWQPDFSRHFNNMRTYCAGDEAGMLMGAWPRGRIESPFPYFAETMTGFEYVAAAEMVFQDMDADAVKVVKAVRDRHDGLKRNPFSEPECGHNYARSMASWNVLLAWLAKHGGNPHDLTETTGGNTR